MLNVIEDTVNNNQCTGCGACILSCAHGCIKIEHTKQGTYQPTFINDACCNCGICVNVCPHSATNKALDTSLFSKSENPAAVGVAGHFLYHALLKDSDELFKSASGGIVTGLVREMMSRQFIDCVVHAECIPACNGEEHFRAVISNSYEEAKTRRGSIYGPVHFDKSLKHFKGQSRKLLLIGTPCVIHAYKNLFSNHPLYKDNTLYTCALVCSHNVSNHFTDYIASYYGFNDREKYTCHYRDKDKSMKNCLNFFVNFKGESGKYTKENRYVTPWVALWRNYYFALNACLDCRDFWGINADISVKDAWGYVGENCQFGSSIMIIRNQTMNSLLCNSTLIHRRKIDIYDVLNSQTKPLFLKHDLTSQDINAKEVYKNNIRISNQLYEAGKINEITERAKQEVSHGRFGEG